MHLNTIIVSFLQSFYGDISLTINGRGNMKEKKIQSKVLSGVIQFKIINHGFYGIALAQLTK